MGLGKTIQAIEAAHTLNLKHILVICPAVARFNWKNEWMDARKEEFWTYHTINSKKATFTNPHSANVTICSYDLAEDYLKNSLIKRSRPQFDALILDEAHYLKSPKTKRTKAIFGKSGIVRYSRRTWMLSGTPVPNHVGELWGVLYTFGKTTLKYDQFIRRYCNFYETTWGIQITGSKLKTMPELKRHFDGFLLRRTKEEVNLELPPITYRYLLVEPAPVDLEMQSSFVQYLFPKDRTDYLFEKLKKERETLTNMVDLMSDPRNTMIERVPNQKTDALAAVALSLSALRRYIGIQKVPPIAKLVREELKEKKYEKVVIFACHRDVIRGLWDELRDLGAVTLYGGHSDEKKEKNVKKFQHSKNTRIFIGNIQAAGTAITLTAAHHVIFIEQDWVPGNNAQAAMRCHRIGQKKPVTIRVASVENSIDQRVNDILTRKVREITNLFKKNELAPTDFEDTTSEPILDNPFD